MSKKVIAIDIDDVLAANAEGFVEFSNMRWGTKLKPEDYHEHWTELWNVDLAEADRRSKEFHESGHVANYKHFEESISVLRKLSKEFSLIIITSRRLSSKNKTIQWLNTYYEDIFDEVYFAGIWDKVDASSIYKTKAKLGKAIGADFLVDDQLKHCLAAAESGINGLLFGNYSWNQINQLPQNVTRVENWEAVGRFFNDRY